MPRLSVTRVDGRGRPLQEQQLHGSPIKLMQAAVGVLDEHVDAAGEPREELLGRSLNTLLEGRPLQLPTVRLDYTVTDAATG